MTVRDLEDLYDYGYWANRKLFEVLANLTPEEFVSDVAGSYGSVRNTLVHAMSAEWGWLSRCGGTERPSRLSPDDFPTAESVTETWSKIESYVREFLSSLRNEDLRRSVEFTLGEDKKRSLLLGDMMHHGAIHAVHHRGQVALLLRLIGHSQGDFDILFFYAERHESFGG